MAGIYIHIPFCKQACHYCDFHFSTNTSGIDRMVDAIASEIVLQKLYLPKTSLDSIYFGGGTPSLLNENQLSKIFNAIQSNFTIKTSCEVTLEANPDDLSIQNLTAFKQIGINRLSIGIQSFNDAILVYLNRAHNAHTASSCVNLAREVGFNNISMDIMYAIPGLSIEGWKENIEKTIQHSPKHISAYSLTIEPQTVFGDRMSKNKLSLVDENLNANQFEMLMRLLKEAGYDQYEISNFSKSNYHSRHNSSYWELEPYLGIGPGAHSFNFSTRKYNIRNNAGYVKSISRGIIPAEVETLSPENKINEYILTTIRTARGCNIEMLKGLYGYDLLKNQDVYLTEIIGKGLAQMDSKALKLTTKGKLFADKITSDLFIVAE